MKTMGMGHAHQLFSRFGVHENCRTVRRQPAGQQVRVSTVREKNESHAWWQVQGGKNLIPIDNMIA